MTQLKAMLHPELNLNAIFGNPLVQNDKDRQPWLQICFVRPWHVGIVR